MDENCLTIQDLFKTDQDSLVIVIVIVIIFTLGWNVYTFLIESLERGKIPRIAENGNTTSSWMDFPIW